MYETASTTSFFGKLTSDLRWKTTFFSARLIQDITVQLYFLHPMQTPPLSAARTPWTLKSPGRHYLKHDLSGLHSPIFKNSDFSWECLFFLILSTWASNPSLHLPASTPLRLWWEVPAGGDASVMLTHRIVPAPCVVGGALPLAAVTQKQLTVINLFTLRWNQTVITSKESCWVFFFLVFHLPHPNRDVTFCGSVLMWFTGA